MAKLHLITYGCQMNEYDSERVAGLLRAHRYELTDREADARRMADDMARDFQAALGRALREQGFEVVSSPLPGAVRLTARIEDLYVTAPENTAAGVRNFARTSGHATLHVQARDAAGAVLIQSEERSDAGDIGRLQRATNVSNRFWFDALFRGWSGDIARRLRQASR